AARTLDDVVGQVAARVPAFGGMYLQGNTLMVYLTSPSERMAAVQAIQAVFGAGRIPAGGVQILPATYGFAQLATWHARMGSLFGIRGVFLTDIDETANRLKIGVVPNTLAVGAVEARLAAMGIPRSAVRIVPMQPFATTATLRDQVRPIEGGLPIALVGHLCRYSDTAYSQRDGTVTADQGFIAKTTGVNTGSLTISGQFRIVSEGPSIVGNVVNKVGRTTGWTQGQVTATCVDVI